jgi:hypothetical protein
VAGYPDIRWSQAESRRNTAKRKSLCVSRVRLVPKADIIGASCLASRSCGHPYRTTAKTVAFVHPNPPRLPPAEMFSFLRSLSAPPPLPGNTLWTRSGVNGGARERRLLREIEGRSCPRLHRGRGHRRRKAHHRSASTCRISPLTKATAGPQWSLPLPTSLEWIARTNVRWNA